jgi:hypothetical protein
MCATDETAKLSGLGSKAYFPDIFVSHVDRPNGRIDGLLPW